MFVRSASSLVALAILTVACERGDAADALLPISVHPNGGPSGSVEVEPEGDSDLDADETGRIVQRGELAFEAPKMEVIDLRHERHAYLLEVTGESTVTLRAEGRSGDLTPSITVHAPLLAGFNPEELAVSDTVDADGLALVERVVLPEAGVYLVVVGDDLGEGRGSYSVVASCEGGACAGAAAIDGCLPEVAEAIVACADRVMDDVDANPEDGVLTALDALHLCTRPAELAPAHFRLCGDTLCDGAIDQTCSVPFEIFAEAQATACIAALQDDMQAPLDMSEIPLSDEVAKVLDEAVASRCPEGSCTIEVKAYAYGDQHPTLKEATLVAAALSNPETTGTYSHSHMWELRQRLNELELATAFKALHIDLGISSDPVVGRLFGAQPVSEHVDLLVETNVVLFRADKLIVTIEVAQPAS